MNVRSDFLLKINLQMTKTLTKKPLNVKTGFLNGTFPQLPKTTQQAFVQSTNCSLRKKRCNLAGEEKSCSRSSGANVTLFNLYLKYL